MKIKLLLILALCLTADSVWRAAQTNYNLGSFLMAAITVLLWLYLAFHRAVDAFCAQGPGRVLKWCFFAGCLFYLALMILVGVLGSVDGPKGDERAVVVLGAAVRGDRVSGLLARRLDAAYNYYVAHPEVILVMSGGQGPGEDIPEGRAMKAYLVEKGVPAEQILTEERSTSTRENFRFSKMVLEEAGVDPTQPIAYVTNRFHCYRAGQYAQLEGFPDVRGIPASIGVSSILPCYLREALAVLYYWVFHR